jgi:hypothetical protein
MAVLDSMGVMDIGSMPLLISGFRVQVPGRSPLKPPKWRLFVWSRCAAWFRTVFEAASGRALFSKDGENGLLRSAAERSGHSGLISLAIQLSFVGRGVHVQSLLKSLAQTFSDEFIAQAETHAEKLGSSLGVMSAISYFMPPALCRRRRVVITVLVIVGVPLIQTISG